MTILSGVTSSVSEAFCGFAKILESDYKTDEKNKANPQQSTKRKCLESQ